MSNANCLRASKERGFLATLLIVVLAGALTLGIQASAARAEGGCSSGQLCIWSGTFYTGSIGYLGCATAPGWNFSIPPSLSAKNRCSIPQEIGWRENGVINWKACMWPGGERPDPGRFNTYRYRASC
jgi:hypothetical protein